MLRHLNEQDIPALVRIETATQFSPWTEEIFKKCMTLSNLAWVIEVDQQVIGFIMVYFNMGEGHILNIAIHPDYQRQGYAELLMNKVLEIAQTEALSKLYLEVRYSNHSAIFLYEKMGFQRVGMRKNYYVTAQSKEDALVFAKDLITLAET